MNKTFKYILSFLGCFILFNVQGLDYRIQDLGTLNSLGSYASGINNQNVITGYIKEDNKKLDNPSYTVEAYCRAFCCRVHYSREISRIKSIHPK